jgi:hypothetical protein
MPRFATLVLAAVALVPQAAHADTSLDRPPDLRGCAEELERARHNLARRFSVFRRASVVIGRNSIELRDPGDETFSFYAAVTTGQPARDDDWDEEMDHDTFAVPEDCPPDEPQFRRARSAHGLRGVVTLDGAGPGVLRAFWPLMRRAIDVCLR